MEHHSPSSAQSKVSQLTNLFHSRSIRRSRSLTGLQKQAQDDLRCQSALDVHPESPGRWSSIRRTKTATIDEETKTDSKKWTITPLVPSATFPLNSSFNRGTRTPSPPSRPKPAPHLWNRGEREDFQRQGSLVGLETTVAPNSGSPYTTHLESTSSSLVSPAKTVTPRTQSPRSKGSPRSKEGSVSRRRKGSVAELVLEPMTTVQEASQDSRAQDINPHPKYMRLTPAATIPHHHYRHHHSQTASLDDQTATTSLEIKQSSSRESLTPRATPASPLEGPSTFPMHHKSFRRSSMLLPECLAPLFIPNSPKALNSPSTMLLPSTTYTGKSPVVPEAAPFETPAPEEKPPKVPPKSPRTLFRAFPTPKISQMPTPKPVVGSSWHTPSSSVSTFSISTATHTANSSVTSFGNNSDMQFHSKPWSPLRSNGSSPAEHSSAPAVATSPLPWANGLRQASPRRPMHNQNNFSIDGTIARPVLIKSASSINLHQRNVSDSVLNRGRPTKRNEGAQRSISRELKLATINGTFDELPGGHRQVSVMSALRTEELLALRITAESQASGFETLAEQDVNVLTIELARLDDHISELRRSTLTLRENRKALHGRMIAFLRAPGNALIPRDHVVAQEGALSKIDGSIDEWTTKLEAAQERRTKVQRKLLEHVSSVLALRIPSRTNSPPNQEQTPPRSPDNVLDPSVICLSMRIEDPQATWQTSISEQRKLEEAQRVEQQRQIEAIELEQLQMEEQRRQRHKTDDTSYEVTFGIEEKQLIEGRKASPLPIKEEVKEVQSYAENGVASLLASIEKEIDAMDHGCRK